MATKEEILDAIANMTVLEISELVKAMEEKFGVSAAPVAVAPVAAADSPADSPHSAVVPAVVSTVPKHE